MATRRIRKRAMVSIAFRLVGCEAHVLLVLISTTDFQSVSFGLVRKRTINLIITLLTNFTLATLLVTIAF